MGKGVAVRWYSRADVWGLLAGLALLLVVGSFAVAFFVLVAMTMRPPAPQLVVGLLPIAGLVVGVLVGAVGGGIAVKRYQSPYRWLGAAATLVLVSILASYTVASRS